jgi:hypothetical protein
MENKDLLFRAWELLEYFSNGGAELGLDVEYFLDWNVENHAFLLENLGIAEGDGYHYRVKLDDYLRVVKDLMREEVKFDIIEERVFGGAGK